MTLVRAVTVFSPEPADLDLRLAENGWYRGYVKDSGAFSVVVPVPVGGESAPLTTLGLPLGPPEVGVVCQKLGLTPGVRVAWSDAFEADVALPDRVLEADDKRVRKARKRLLEAAKRRP